MQPRRTEMRIARRSTPPARRRAPSALSQVGGGVRITACDHDVRLSLAAVLLLVFDFACLGVAAWAATSLQPTPVSAPPSGIGPARAAWMAAVLAPFVLYDRRFGAGSLQIGSHVLRFALFTIVALVLAAMVQVLHTATRGWLVTFFAVGFLSTSLARILLARCMLGLRRHGALSEVVAIVGAGLLADRLIQQLQRLHPDSIRISGVFDDDPCATCDGTIDNLIELGSVRRIDWIVLALPPGAESNALVQRLMALAVPITVCPQHLGLAPDRPVGYVGGSIPVSVVVDRPPAERDDFLHAMEEFVPRWVITWTRLAFRAMGALASGWALGTARQDVPLSVLDHDVTALFCLCGHARHRRAKPTARTPERMPETSQGVRSRRPRTARPPLPHPAAARTAQAAPATLPPQ